MQSAETANVFPRREGRSSQVLVIFLAALAGIAIGAAIIRLATVPLGCDQAWGVYAALQLLHGVKLNSSQLVEVNPPFILWFSAIPGWVSEHSSFSAVECFHGFLTAGLLLAGAWAAAIYRRTRGGGLLCWWVFVLMLAAQSAFVAVSDVLGEREHLLAYFILPYLLGAALRIEGTVLARWHLVLIGLAGAVSLCLKPQYALVVIVVEMLVLLRVQRLSRWFDLSVVILAVGVAAYVVAVLVTGPTYLTTVVPLIKETYWGLDKSMAAVFTPAKKTLVLLAAGTVFYFVRRKRMANEAFMSVLLVASFSSLVVFLQQHKGWVYQMMPFKIFSYLALTVFLADTVSALLRGDADSEEADVSPLVGTGPIGGPMVVAAVLLVVSLVFFARRHVVVQNDVSTIETLRELYAPYPAGTTVSYLSIDAWEFPAVLEQNKVWGSRYMHLWMLPAIVRSADPLDTRVKQHLTPAQEAQLSQQLRSTVTEDLATFKPVIVNVDPCGRMNLCPALSREGYGNVLEWFKADSGFQSEWAHYEYVRTDDKLLVFVRKS